LSTLNDPNGPILLFWVEDFFLEINFLMISL